MLAGQAIISFKSIVLQFQQDGKNANGCHTISYGVEDDPLAGPFVHRHNSKKHKTCLRNTGISQHSFYALLEYRGKITDQQSSGRNDRNDQLPVCAEVSTCKTHMEQTHEGNKT